MADLKYALEKIIVNFDRRIHVTDLIDKYDLTYEEVNKILESYICEQEKKGSKYEKRFMVHGERKEDSSEVYAVVEGEAALKKWKEELKNIETSLYSVEIDGGAKAPAQEFKPVQRYEIKITNLKERANSQHKNGTTNNSSASSSALITNKAATKEVDTKIDLKKENTEAKKTPPEKTKTEKKKKSPEEKKPTPKSANKKGSINNFFAASNKTTEKTNATVKTASPTKKASNFFKSDSGKSPKKEIKEEPNQSVQLFDDSEESSDEEEKLNAIKRDIISADHEESTISSSKRRRILDSDEEDDEGPTQKHEKTEKVEEAKATVKSETLLDEDGFVVTVKSKKSNVARDADKTKEEKKSTVKTPIKMPSKPLVAKSKQGNIMNFFKKM